MSAAIGASRAAWLLTRLRLRRLLNQFGSAVLRRRVGSAKRAATPGKSSAGWIVGVAAGGLMLVTFTNLAYHGLSNIKAVLGSARVVEGASFELMLLLISGLLVTLGSKELAQPDWDLEWLVTLPMSLSTLLGVRLVERTIVNPIGILTMWPFLTVAVWERGCRWSAPVIGFGVTLALLVIAALMRTLVDTGLRLTMSPPKLRNLQAVISIGGTLLLYLTMSVGLSGRSFVLDWTRWLPAWTLWLPPGLAIRALMPGSLVVSAGVLGLMLVEIVILVGFGFILLKRQLRQGVIATGARESGGRTLPRPTSETVAEAEGQPRLLSTIQRRELRLLSRDRNFLVQTLVLPVVVMGMQFLFSTRTNLFAAAARNPAQLAATAFGLAAYALMFSAFQTLNAEGQSLWILYCVPHSLESILRQKAKLWAMVVVVYPVAVFGIGIGLARAISWQLVGLATVVLLGVPIYSVIATALGVFGCDPLAQEVQRRVRPSYLYLYMLLGSLYGYAIFASNFWQRATLVILTTLLALALWQKARDQLPYLLDATASPPPRVSLSDGLIAVLIFFVVQGIVITASLHGKGPGAMLLTGRILLRAFCIAGAVTFGLVRLVYWRAHTTGVPRVTGPGLSRALLWGAAGGVGASIAGIIYMQIVLRTGAFRELLRQTVLPDPSAARLLLVLAVVAAPLFEEFIFRGLVFGGLRRSLGLGGAVAASAAIFAIIHPPVAVVPVFILGAIAAVVYDRTKMLAAPMVAHALYNLALLSLHWISRVPPR